MGTGVWQKRVRFLGAPAKSRLPPPALQGPVGLTGRAGAPVSAWEHGNHRVWGHLPSRAGCVSTDPPPSCLPHRATQGLLERRETLGGLVLQDPSASEDEM